MQYKRLPYLAYTIPILLLAAIGVAASAYLALSHYRNYTDIGYSSFCAISKAINCDTVSQSSWSVLFGLPLALWGTFVYALFFILALPAQQINSPERRGLWELLFGLALICSAADVYFGYVSAVEIQAYCIMCLLTYAVSFTLLFLIWIIRRRFNNHSFSVGIRNALFFLSKDRYILSALSCLLAAFICLKIFLPAYWIYEYPEFSTDVHSGVTEEGHPWIGAEHPVMVINEFTDYQCFQCSKMHFVLRQLVARHPDALRLVHHHYPMDENFNTVLVKKPFHTGSGTLALLAIASMQQDKFWFVNDSLYYVIRNGIKEFNISKFAKKAGLDAEQLKKDMYSPVVLKQLQADIWTGLKNKIVGTPAFIINGKVYQGQIPAEILKKVTELPGK
ncbi:vitamin K epoxide reductase family protein [Candidatus Electronema sp. PJ]|uniref:vitamin K epoxide reductase/DsbA family protein n=1 Tax=Candidatus Electronema sp. PJ TaxID=3401572 RepID=UPI003AA7C2A5